MDRINIRIGKFDVSASVAKTPETEEDLAEILIELAAMLKAPRTLITKEEDI